jgi:hypothetical protein
LNGGVRIPQNATGLSEIYRAAGVPEVTSPESLPSGKRRMLAARKLKGKSTDLQRSRLCDEASALTIRPPYRAATLTIFLDMPRP